jgi:hypothetical protein
MRRSRASLAVVLVLLSLAACGGSTTSGRPKGGASGSGGGDGGSDGSSSGSGGSGGTHASGGSGGAGGAAVVDASSGSSDTMTSGAADGAAAESGGPGMSADGGPGSDGGVAICWKDPKVIMICHQLENACINCGSGKNPPANTDAVACFELIKKAYAGVATDQDCVDFATAHKCKPDDATTTGNVCGGLNCQVPGCKDPAMCEFVKQDGESDKCQPYVATCPCK